MKKQKQTLRIIMIIALFLTIHDYKSQIFINEIMVNPSGPNDGANMPNTAEWIELYNPSISAVNIGCWFFTDGDFAVTFPAGTTIPAGGYYTIASAAGSGFTPNLNWATCGCTSGPASEIGIFTNSAEQVILYNSAGTIVDAIIWSTGQLPDAMTTSVFGSCSSLSVSFPASGATYESIGSHTDGVAKERSIDGGSSWQNAPSPTFGASNASILPLELLAFNAQIDNSAVKINWTTATEINNDFFTVERSSDGVFFERLFTQKGAGNSLKNINYSYTDFNPINGISYYRLKQTDFNGNYSYSNIESVSLDKNEIFIVYPNPNENGMLRINSINASRSEIKLIDALGREIYKSQSEDSNTEIDLTAFEKGIYILFITTESSIFNRKIIYK